MNSKNNKTFYTITLAIVICTFIFLGITIISKIFSIQDLNFQLISALLGTIISGIVTVLLLRGQSEIEENKDIGIHLFEQKQKTYFDFIETLENITQDGKINVPGTVDYKEPKSTDEINDELQHLLYQLGKVQMTASKETSDAVTAKVGKLLSIGLGKGTDKSEVYSSFAENLFGIVADLRRDLYASASSVKSEKEFTPVSKDTIIETIRNAGVDDSSQNVNEKENVLSDYVDLIVAELKSSYPNTDSTYIRFIGGKDTLDNTTSLVAAKRFLDSTKQNTKYIQICCPLKGKEFLAIELVNDLKYPHTQIQGGIRTMYSWKSKFNDAELKKINFVTEDTAYKQFKDMEKAGRVQIVKEFLESCDKLKVFLEKE